jgi:cytochrome oxidase Cu insertion factor (SCO1/SenC/PrrC family)
MSKLKLLLTCLLGGVAIAQGVPTEQGFRQSLGLGSGVRMDYRDAECKPVNFDGFVAGMRQTGAGAEVERAADGSAVTMTVRIRGRERCASPYPPLVSMPPFDLEDLAGKRVTSASLRGKTTMVSFFFSTCVPCILEVEPLNRFAAARPHMNFLAVTFDEPEEARAFVKRFGVRWRVVADARDFVERMRVKQFPMIALFDAQGRLLGTRVGGVKDELEAAAVEPQLRRWMESVLRQQGG